MSVVLSLVCMAVAQVVSSSQRLVVVCGDGKRRSGACGRCSFNGPVVVENKYWFAWCLFNKCICNSVALIVAPMLSNA